MALLRQGFQAFYFTHGCKLIIPLSGCIKQNDNSCVRQKKKKRKKMLHNWCKDSTLEDFVMFFQTFYRYFVDICTKMIYFYITHILYPCHWNIITTLNGNTKKFNLLWIPISLAIVTPHQTEQFAINVNVFIKFYLVSHFGL